MVPDRAPLWLAIDVALAPVLAALARVVHERDYHTWRQTSLAHLVGSALLLLLITCSLIAISHQQVVLEVQGHHPVYCNHSCRVVGSGIQRGVRHHHHASSEATWVLPPRYIRWWAVGQKAKSNLPGKVHQELLFLDSTCFASS